MGIVAVLILIGLGIGGIKIMQHIQHNEMVNTVKSEEVQNIIENNLKLRHEDALKSGDVIQSYQIDMDSIKHSPMGGIIFKVYINNDNLITVFQPNPKTFISQRSLSNIVRIGKLLKEFHSKKFQAENTFNPIDQFNSYYNQIDELPYGLDDYMYIIDEFKKLYKADRLCHNDLVEGNFLFTKDALYLIDFEYAGYNDYYFDIASFISENDLNYEETITFLKAYFTDEECNYDKLKVFLNFCDLLWYTWATLLYEKRNEEIYNEIAKEKLHRLKNPRKIVY